MNVDREKLMSMLDKYAAAREAGAVEEERAKKCREIAWDVYHELCVYLDECTAKTERAEVVPVPPQVPCSVCKYWYIGHCNLKGVDIEGTRPHCDKLEFPIPLADAPAEPERPTIVRLVNCEECKHLQPTKDLGNAVKCKESGDVFTLPREAVPCKKFEPFPEVACLECKYAERVNAASNTWRCVKGFIFVDFAKVKCREFEQIDKATAVPRFCGSCKYCKQSDKDPDGVECTLTRTEFLPIVRWSTACPDFEEAQP